MGLMGGGMGAKLSISPRRRRSRDSKFISECKQQPITTCWIANTSVGGVFLKRGPKKAERDAHQVRGHRGRISDLFNRMVYRNCLVVIIN
jgi:hypothetical protein